ncbi:hypothetical protein UK23_27370 [Lentzea aerocolonigenes]|uniref:Uncharacterized protein n=1 Tax=Lentzea aerocolonigenes TaxID=68170 RepID=A0A0F0GP63_LENAE|nr:hypothetical protein [Lentzea aerocolonigenes]KJK45090.1 hypothetical protein UK23_27370 [Lentzea aerocolonigenes]
MTEIDRARSAALVGFTATAALLVLTAAALLNPALDPFGGSGGGGGGGYVVAFFYIAIGSALVGVIVRKAAPAPWRSAGSGLVLAGLIGVAVFAALMLAVYWSLSNTIH